MATMTMAYGWGRVVYEVDAASRGGAALRVDTRDEAQEAVAERPTERRTSAPRIADLRGVGDPVTSRRDARRVQAVWFGPLRVSEAYRPGALDAVAADERKWCEFLRDHEGLREVSLNGDLFWTAAASVEIKNALDALRD